MVVRIHLGQLSKELWQTWCMRRTENPENVVQLHEAPQLLQPYGITAAQQVLALLVKVRLLLGQLYGVCGREVQAQGCGSCLRRFESCQTPKMVGSSNRSGLQIFNLSTRVRSSYRLHYKLDMVFNGSIRTLGVCGVSSSLAIQTKRLLPKNTT